MEVKTEVVVDALAYTLKEIKPRKFYDTLADKQGIVHTISS